MGKSSKTLILIFAGLMLGLSSRAATTVEIAIEKAFISPEGFDDNDNVEVVLAGHLPNLCYKVGKGSVRIDRSKKVILVKQTATKRSALDACTSQSNMPEHLKWPVPFSTTVELGRLEAGNYQVRYRTNQGLFNRGFKIEKAPTAQVDNMLYAPITRAFIPEVLYATKNAEVVLSGVLESTCTELKSSDIQVLRFGDVIVVLPKLTLYQYGKCQLKARPLQKVLDLGELTPGRYLLHVRSIAGQSVNRTFQVIERDQDPSSGHAEP